VAATRAYLERHEHAILEINGAARLLARLLDEPGVRVAVATGGWYETATLKLRYVGIDPARFALATASDAVARTAIMRLAQERASGVQAFRKVTYFGDGPWDRRASAELGYDFIAVGRGVEHSLRFDDLADHEAIVTALRI
jgi:phosphoglycolate phosphatase-like HAD superfamily hydrolase